MESQSQKQRLKKNFYKKKKKKDANNNDKHTNEVPVVENRNKYQLLKVRNLYKLYIKNQRHCA